MNGLLLAAAVGASVSFARPPAVGNTNEHLTVTVAADAAGGGFATAAIQSARDRVAAAGGGRVVVSKGRYRTGCLCVRSNTTFELAEGAVLEGSGDWRDWTKRSLIWVSRATNVTIRGRGTVFGNGRKFDRRGPKTQRAYSLCYFLNCRNVRLEGVTFRESPAWTVNVRRVDGFYGNGFNVSSHGCCENDGVDVEARNALIENCDIESDDDAMCMKGDTRDYTVENVEIRNCRLSSNCNFIKLGTTISGVMRNVDIHDCALIARGSFSICDWRKRVPGLKTALSGLSGIAVEMVDGGQLYDISVRNITMTQCAQTPIFVRMGRRRTDGRGPSRLENVLIENVKGDAVSQIACSITGVPAEGGHPALRPRNIVLRNVDLVFPGGGTKAAAFARPVPEHPAKYPENTMFDWQMLPAFAFYVRHADGVRFENVRWRTLRPDEREPLVQEDADVIEVRDLTFPVRGSVDPSIGTAATGHAFPGPCRPFGLVQPSPDTGNGSWKYCSGYAWTDTAIRRFSQTHVNGTGQAGLGDVGILPFAGDVPDPMTASAPFAKSKERIELGYYGVTLDNGVKVEIASGRRLARYRMSFPAGRRGGVLLDFPWGLYRQKGYLPHLTTTCEVSRVSARRWTGRNHSEIWAPRDIHYVVEFDRAPDEVIELPRSAKGPQTAAVFAGGSTVELAIAISPNSPEGAVRNFDAECGCSFDQLVGETRAEWDRLLSRIDWRCVPADERKSVATAVYHLCVQPNEISDVGDPVRYSTFSLWDTFRDAHPLYEKLVPERVPGFVNSLLAHDDRWGYLPQWELWGRETGSMIGSHAVPVIVAAAEHGFGGFDKEKAYQAVRDTLRKSERPGMGLTYPRRTDWDVLDRYGYYPYDVIKRESVSRTLECCYDDACAARFAKVLGKDEDAAFFERRSWGFTNLFDAATCCFRPKDAQGRWLEDFNPAGLSPHFTEGSALQWSWYVLHRPEWLIEAMGGKTAFKARLDAFFAGTLFPGADRGTSQDITGLIGDYAHGNEPCHHVIGLYRLVGRNDKAAALERQVCERFYRPTPDGLCGNDDCGQMSAWYLRRFAGFQAGVNAGPVGPRIGK